LKCHVDVTNFPYLKNQASGMGFLEVAGREGMIVFGLARSVASRMYWRNGCGLIKGGGNPAFSFSARLSQRTHFRIEPCHPGMAALRC
jgi:hypothetical protein